MTKKVWGTSSKFIRARKFIDYQLIIMTDKLFQNSWGHETMKFIRGKKLSHIDFHHDEKKVWGTSLSCDSLKIYTREKMLLTSHFHHDEKTFSKFLGS